MIPYIHAEVVVMKRENALGMKKVGQELGNETRLRRKTHLIG